MNAAVLSPLSELEWAAHLAAAVLGLFYVLLMVGPNGSGDF